MLASSEREAMQAAQGAYLPDVCHQLVWDSAPDSLGEDIDTYHEGPAVACGFRFGAGNRTERTGVDGLPVRVDATLRLPLALSVCERDRILLTHRHGQELVPPLIFAVIPPVETGPTAKLLRLRQVTA